MFLCLAAWIAQAKSQKLTECERIDNQNRQTAKQLCSIAVLGGALGGNNLINTHLSGVLPSVITFPIINGGVILVTTIMSKLFFKEKLSLLQKNRHSYWCCFYIMHNHSRRVGLKLLSYKFI